jgi:hypothetical protein
MPPVPKAVLISLADQANDEGVCWPSVANIVKRTCLSERSVQRAIAWLELAGALKTNERNGRSTYYNLTPAGYAPPSDSHPVPQTPTGDGLTPPPPSDGHPGGATLAPRTVIEPSVEPSREPVAPRHEARRRTNGYHILYDWTAHKFTGIRDDEILAWQEAHPAISVPDQLARAEAWLKANPARKKSNYESFIVKWLGRAQDRGAPAR